jgi:serine/threonine protein kinase
VLPSSCQSLHNPQIQPNEAKCTSGPLLSEIYERIVANSDVAHHLRAFRNTTALSSTRVMRHLSGISPSGVSVRAPKLKARGGGGGDGAAAPVVAVGPDSYAFLKVLGKGSFGKVMLAEDRVTKKTVAIKILKKDVLVEDDDVECAIAERNVLQVACGHPYLTRMDACFQSPDRCVTCNVSSLHADVHYLDGI